RGELGALPAVEQLHAERVAVEPHRYLHAGHPKRHRRNLLNHGRTTRMIPSISLASARNKSPSRSKKLRNVSRVKESEGTWSGLCWCIQQLSSPESSARLQQWQLSIQPSRALRPWGWPSSSSAQTSPTPWLDKCADATASRMPPPAFECDKL